MADKYISAEALTLSLRDDPDLNAASFARVKRHIEAAPDMVKRGVWVEHRPNVYECTACHTWYGNYGGCNEWNYCPNCGAKMDEED